MGGSKGAQRLTSAMGCGLRWSQADDEIVKCPEREISRKSGKRCRERKLEASAQSGGRRRRGRKWGLTTPSESIDSILLSRLPPSSGVNAEMVAVRGCMSSSLK
jgi:hypothetical protein